MLYYARSTCRVSDFRQNIVFAQEKICQRENRSRQRARVSQTGMRSRRTSSVGKRLCRIANCIGGASRQGAREASGLDIERKRAMFRRYTCPDFSDWACAESAPHSLMRNFRTDEGLSKAAVIFQAQIEKVEWRNGK
jgi:hypothetical protein